tara:strand:- start:55 stop:282 length:228 start_codon:yes stop_codon:yes gene_type:complete
VQRTRASKVIRLRVYPKILRKIKVDKIEIGTVKKGIIVVVIFLKKNKMIIVTRVIAKHKVKITSSSASDTKREVS